MRRRTIHAILALALSTGWARTATACAMCLSATEETREAYYATTALLALLPFLLIGAIGLWLRRAARASRDATLLPAEHRDHRQGSNRGEAPSHP
jgi:hypothetical protein